MIDPAKAERLLEFLRRNTRYKESFEKHRAGLEAWHRGMEKAEEYPQNSDERREGVKEAYAALHGKRHPDLDASQFWGEIYDLPIERFTRIPFDVRWPDGNRAGMRVLSADEAMVFLDPQENIDAIEKSRREYVLSQIFAWTGIKPLPLDEKDDPDCARLRYSLRLPEKKEFIITLPDEMAAFVRPLEELIAPSDPRGDLPYDPRFGIEPHRQVLLVDIQRTRSQLLEEFEDFLDGIGKDTRKERRVRAEWRKQLEIWDMRQEGLTFEEIAEKKGIELSTARSRYLRAFALIEGWKLIRSCEDCPKLGTNECDTCPVAKKAERAMSRAPHVKCLKPMVPPVKTPPGWDSEFPPEETGLSKDQVDEIIAIHKAADLGGSPSANVGQAWTDMGGRQTWELQTSTSKKGVVLRKAAKKATDPPPGE